jgi:general secretion pathway protein I
LNVARGAAPIGAASGARRLASPGIQSGEEAQAGQNYRWQEEIIATPNPTMRRIIVSVYAPDDPKHVLRELTGYLVQYPR